MSRNKFHKLGALLLSVSRRKNKSPYIINAALYIPTQRLLTKSTKRDLYSRGNIKLVLPNSGAGPK